jgi:hypothetical protein
MQSLHGTADLSDHRNSPGRLLLVHRVATINA